MIRVSVHLDGRPPTLVPCRLANGWAVFEALAFRAIGFGLDPHAQQLKELWLCTRDGVAPLGASLQTAEHSPGARRRRHQKHKQQPSAVCRAPRDFPKAAQFPLPPASKPPLLAGGPAVVAGRRHLRDICASARRARRNAAPAANFHAAPMWGGAAPLRASQQRSAALTHHCARVRSFGALHASGRRARRPRCSAPTGGAAVCAASYDPGDWSLSPEFFGTQARVLACTTRRAPPSRRAQGAAQRLIPLSYPSQGGGWGHGPGRVVFQTQSRCGNGAVRVTAHEASQRAPDGGQQARPGVYRMPQAER